MTEQDDLEWVTAFFAAAESSDRRAQEAFSRIGDRPGHRVMTYRCRRRCLLFAVVRTPEGLIFHRPSYELFSKSAAKLTADGEPRRPAETGWESSWGDAALVCHHLLDVPLPKAVIRQHLGTDVTEWVVDRSGNFVPSE